MKKSSKKAQNCNDHTYCPHQHFRNCRTQRYRNISYTSKPSDQVDLACNVHPKMILNKTLVNIPTRAYQQFSINPILPEQEETNFSKNYYLQNCPQKFRLYNNLVRDLQRKIEETNAYTLAAGATKDYNIFANQRKQHLKNAQRRAKIQYCHFFEEKATNQQKQKEQQVRWITDYVRKVEELIKHILGKSSQNVDPNLQDKLFLKEQAGKNVKYLSKLKVGDPTAALNILKSVRAILITKKIDLQQLRNDKEHANQSATASFFDTSGNQTQNISQTASFISTATNQTATSRFGEAHLAEQYCNFEELKKEWGATTIQQIRNILRRLLTNTLINRAEGVNMREKKQSIKKDELLRKQMQSLGAMRSTSAPSKTNKNNKSTKGNSKSKQMAAEITELMPTFRQNLSKQQQIVKSTLIKGGCFDSLGDTYNRNRNYSLLFTKRGNQISYIFKKQNKQLFETGYQLKR